jgi:hypothetical protein
MNIHREGKFFVGNDLQGNLLLGIESGQLADCVAETKRRKAYGVFGSPGFGFHEDNLDFLNDLPGLKSIWFWDIALKNIDGVYALKKLRKFGVHDKRPPIDFARLPKLERVTWKYEAKDTGVSALPELRELDLWRYSPKSKSFGDLELPTTVEEMSIIFANPATLEGLPIFPNLKRLQLSRMRNLISLAELPRIAPQLEHLVVTNCSRVADGPKVVRHLPHLNHAWVHNALLVSK